MKKTMLKKMGWLLLIGVPLLGLAEGNEILGSVTGVQSYVAASSTGNNLANTAPVAPTKSASVPPSSAVVSPPSTPRTAVPLLANTAEALQAQLEQLNQNMLVFQQKINAQLIDLENKNQFLQQQLDQLTQAMVLLNQETVTMRSQGNLSSGVQSRHGLTNHWVNWMHSIENRWGSTTFKGVIVAVTLILILVIGMIWPRRKSSKKEETAEDTQDEYDYLGSAESMPAKLDLARTYLAMEDYVAAKEVLAEVIERGNPAQRQEAADLLKAMPVEP